MSTINVLTTPVNSTVRVRRTPFTIEIRYGLIPMYGSDVVNRSISI